jgi:serine/threonine protein kinase
MATSQNKTAAGHAMKGAPATMQPSAPPQPPALAPGTMLLDRYFIQGYISGGGFGHIYRAQDKVLGHRRAIKEAFYRDPNTQRQFRLEAEFLINARHPNLVQGYTLFEQLGRYYLVMDYVDGYTLEDITIQHIRRIGYPLIETQILDWIIPICDAVRSLHQQPTPIIHRDIKPANIKLNRQGVPVLIDLGLAKLYYRGSQTIGAALAFTPGYAPPEQYQASGATDQRTDVYAMGATLYYLLTGYQPTEAPARLSSTTLPAPRQLNPRLSQATEVALLQAMSLDPAARQQTMEDLMTDLKAARSLLTTGKIPAVSADDERRIPCTRCGTANVLAARFCMRCGNPLRNDVVKEPQPVAAAVMAAAAPAAPAPAEAYARMLPLPSPYATFPAAISQRLLRRSPADNQEVMTVLASMLGAIAFALGLLAVISGWLLVFTLPALGLAAWSSWQWWRVPQKAPPEFRWLSAGIVVLSMLWIAFYFLIFHLNR